jgi:hypothetical protein
MHDDWTRYTPGCEAAEDTGFGGVGMHDIIPSNSDETPQHPEGSKIAEGRNLPHKLCHLDYSYCLGNLGQHASLASATDRQRYLEAAMIETVNGE